MAKVIRNQWVYKRHNKVIRYLPRRNDGIKEYDFDAHAAGPENFPEKMEGSPPKLWLAWIYRRPIGEPTWTKERLKKLFGDDLKPGKMEIFKNTPSQNAELWHVKHLIELRPVTFPNGEPTAEDVRSLEVFADGRCVIDKRLECDESQLEFVDPLKQFTQSELSSRLQSRYFGYKDIFEDNVYMPSNISVID